MQGSPVLLNGSIPQEPDFLELLDVYRPAITALGDKIVGYTKVYLEGGRSCRSHECNLGNLIADSMVNARVLENKGGDYWTDAAVALIMGGGKICLMFEQACGLKQMIFTCCVGIRTSISKNSEGSLSLRDIGDTIPFENRLFLTRITGKTLRNALEHSASVRRTDSNGGFLQVSGIHVEYDYSKEDGSRVTSALVRCAQCHVPSYSNLNDTASYNVIIPEFFLQGGDGYTLVEEQNRFTELLQKNDIEALEQYLHGRNFVHPEVEGRIRIKA